MPSVSETYRQSQIQSFSTDPPDSTSGFVIGPPAELTFKSIRRQLFAAISTSWIQLSYGHSIGYATSSYRTMPEHIPMTVKEIAVFTSALPLGGALGAILGAPFIMHFGRKRTLLVSVSISITGLILQYFSLNSWMITIGRTIMGISHGIATVAIPIYISEITQKNVRGALTTLPYLFQVTGIACVYFPSSVLNWRHLLIVALVLLLPFLISFSFIPESPRWYLIKGRMEAARIALVRLRYEGYDTDDEFDEMVTHYISKSFWKSYMEMASKTLVKPFLITIGLMMFQQLTGVGVFFFHLISLVIESKFLTDPYVVIAIIGAVNLVAVIITCIAVDITGRKILLYISAGSVILALTIMSVYFHCMASKTPFSSWIPFVAIIIFILGYSVGYGYMPIVLTCEILPHKYKHIAASIVIAIQHLFTFLVTLLFPITKTYMGTAVCFWVFVVMTAIGILFVLKFVPETSSRTLEEIERAILRRRIVRSLAEAFGY